MLNGFDTDTILSENFVKSAIGDGKGNFGLYTKNLKGAQGIAQIALCKKYGAKVWFIYEGMGDEATMEQGAPRGQTDGASAKAVLTALDVPATIPVFAAVDYSAVGSQEIAEVDSYMEGFQKGCAPFPQGDYGDGAVVLSLPNSPGYVAGAMGWPEVAQVQNNPAAYPNVKILQHEETTAYGVGVDRCTILDESVLWDCGVALAAPEPAPAPPPAPETAPAPVTPSPAPPPAPAFNAIEYLLASPTSGTFYVRLGAFQAAHGLDEDENIGLNTLRALWNASQ